MIDFHTHVLPRIDDGSESLEMSIKMLKADFRAGVDTVICSSHCHPHTNDSLKAFVQKRELAFLDLQNEIKDMDDVPKILRGCELHLTTDISDFPNLSDLCIEGTNYIMLEMPFERWDDWLYDTIYSISLRGLKPVIAHIERYAHMKDKLHNLFELDIIYQINTDSFLNARSRRFITQLIRDGYGHIIGSDMHNLTTRATTYAEAFKIIETKFGIEYARYFIENSISLINNTHIHRHTHRYLPKPKYRLI